MFKFCFALTMCALFTSSFAGSVAPLTGKQIVGKCLEQGKHYQDMVQDVTMKLIDADGQVQKRAMRFKALLTESREKYSLITFTAPRREKGIALLTVAPDEKAQGEQYLYLPSTRRVKRVLGASRNASFRGSEFSFEDLADQSLDHYRFELVDEQACGQANCFIVDRFPLQDDSNYQRTRLWIDSSVFRLIKADFYDLAGNPLKTLNAENFKKAGNDFWYPQQLVMNNHQSGKRTEMIVKSMELNKGLKTTDFSERAMRRAR